MDICPIYFLDGSCPYCNSKLSMLDKFDKVVYNYEMGDRSAVGYMCPSCGRFFDIYWEKINGEKDKNGDDVYVPRASSFGYYRSIALRSFIKSIEEYENKLK